MKINFTTSLVLLVAPTLLTARPTSSSSSASVDKRDSRSNGDSVVEKRTVIEVPLHQRVKRDRSRESFLAKANHIKNKYGFNTPATRQKRAGAITLTSYQDSEYVGSIQIGTPPETHTVILDTGSADLIMAAQGCTGCASTTNGYSASESTSSATSSQSFRIQYGSGSASGTLVQDNVTIGGYTVNPQTFASCNVMNNIVAGNISGLLGLGWQNLATSGAVPLVEALAQDGALPAEVFGFYLKSYAYDELTSDYMPGGKLTIGGTDTSAYSGELNWIPLSDSSRTYWSIPLQGITVQGSNTGVTSDSVVIDSGTTLIGAPGSAVDAIYSQISGAQAVTLSGQAGYYAIPCSSSVKVSFTFGGVEYAIPPDSFNAGAFDSRGIQCLGAVFALTSSSPAPTTSNTLTWIIGDAFLTGVYSAFRFSSPAAVGFASLGSGGTAVNGSTSSGGTSSSTVSISSSSRSTPASLAALIVTGLMIAIVA